jgi:hypothetical protein
VVFDGIVSSATEILGNFGPSIAIIFVCEVEHPFLLETPFLLFNAGI